MIATLVVALPAAGWLASGDRMGPGAPVYRTAVVERGDLVSTVTTSGAVNALVTVAVGSQLSGQISELFADFNDEVRKDQPLARIDPKSFEARANEAAAEVEIARAELLSRQAAREQAVADVANARNARAVAEAQTASARAIYVEAERDHQRKQPLAARGTISKSELDRVRAQRDSAHAQLRAADARQRAEVAAIAGAEAAIRVAKAQVEIARAAVRQRQAALDFTKVDLARTVIRAPLDGVVIGRNVELGQTVAASLQAPTLFTIAQDLRRMQVEANVDEADIGRIKPGQRVSFTVDAYLGRSFRGAIVDIHKAPQVFQNVVTYTVVISAENSDLALLPGMTATVRIVVAEKADVLKVPNAALRFRPPGGVPTAVTPTKAVVRAGRGVGGSGGGGASDGTAGGGGTGGARAGEAGSAGPGVVWVLGQDDVPVAVPVRTGTSDGSATEILTGPLGKAKKKQAARSKETPSTGFVSGTLREGQEVIVGIKKRRDKKTVWGLRWGF